MQIVNRVTGEIQVFIRLLADSVLYTIKGVVVRIVYWPLLILAALLFTIPLNGYLVRIYRGADPAPDFHEWKSLFSEGLKLTIIQIIYFVVAGILLNGILAVSSYSSLPAGLIPSDITLVSYLGFIFIYLTLPFLIFLFILGVMLSISSIRFARSNQIFEAFNVGAIIRQISKIGWFRYIAAIIFSVLFFGVPLSVLGFVVIMAIWLLGILEADFEYVLTLLRVTFVFLLLISPLIIVFHARYMTVLYDSSDYPEEELNSAVSA